MERLEKYKNLKLWYTSSDSTGCGFYRSFLPSQYMNKYFPTVLYASGFPPNHPDRDNHDVYFIQRTNNDFFLDWIPKIRATGRKVFYDIDDNLWEIPSSNLAHKYYPPKELKRVATIIKLCDGVVTSTVPLQGYLKKFHDNVHVIPNMIQDVFQPKSNPDDLIHLGWAGSYTHNGDFTNHLVRYIEELVKQKRIEKFTCFGFTPQYFKHIAQTEIWSDSDKYIDKLKELSYDIGVIVTDDNFFNKCKSNIKFLEYSGIGCASVAHSAYPYETTMTHGETGYLVKKEKTDWREYIDYMLKNPEERIRISNNAFEFVKNNYTYANTGTLILEKYLDVLDSVF
jgi:hypothetical protein